MRKYLLCLLSIGLILFFISGLYFGDTYALFPAGGGMAASGSGAAGGIYDGNCDTVWHEVTTIQNHYALNSSIFYYFGQVVTTGGSPQALCRVDFSLDATEGYNISQYTWYVQVYTMDGDNLDTLVTNGESNGVVGDNSWNNTLVEFDFSTPPELAASTQYAVVITSKEVPNSTDYIRANYSADAVAGFMGRWTSDKAKNYFYNSGGTNFDFVLKFYD